MTSQTNFRPRARVAIATAALWLAACFGAGPLLVSAQEKGQSPSDGTRKGGGAVELKPPKGYSPVEFAGFKGVLMINPKKAAGMFITYANEGETVEALRERVRDAIAPMFIHDKGKPKPEPLAWETSALPSHPEDGGGKATLYTHGEEKTEVQVATYEIAGARPVLYGYFAMRHKPKSKGTTARSSTSKARASRSSTSSGNRSAARARSEGRRQPPRVHKRRGLIPR